MPRGGKRKGAGRKHSGRVAYATRLMPEKIAWIKAEAQRTGKEDCQVIESRLG